MEAIISISADEVMEDYNNKLTFKDLNIDYDHVVILFMSKGLLPKNYLSLTPNNNQARLKV